MPTSKVPSAATVGDTVEGDAVESTNTLVGACDVGVPVALARKSVAVVGDGVLGDAVDDSRTCNVGVPVARTALVGASGEDEVGDGVDSIGACDGDVGVRVVSMTPVGERVVGENVGPAVFIGVSVAGQAIVWHGAKLDAHSCPTCKHKAASTGDSMPYSTIMHVGVEVAIPTPHVTEQGRCVCLHT